MAAFYSIHFIKKYFNEWLITSKFSSGGRFHVAFNVISIIIFFILFVYGFISENSIIGGRYVGKNN